MRGQGTTLKIIGIMKTQPTERIISRLLFSIRACSSKDFVTFGMVSLQTDTKITKSY